MPLLQRPGRPSLYYIVDDYTDPWAQKPWLVLQHAYSRSGVLFRQWVPHLARHYRILRADRRGLGQSTRALVCRGMRAGERRCLDRTVARRSQGERRTLPRQGSGADAGSIPRQAR
jgi:pimeloyl-ACP methyl ester carboxylesterase